MPRIGIRNGAFTTRYNSLASIYSPKNSESATRRGSIQTERHTPLPGEEHFSHSRIPIPFEIKERNKTVSDRGSRKLAVSREAVQLRWLGFLLSTGTERRVRAFSRRCKPPTVSGNILRTVVNKNRTTRQNTINLPLVLLFRFVFLTEAARHSRFLSSAYTSDLRGENARLNQSPKPPTSV